MSPQDAAAETALTGRGEQTRRLILETALRLFKERGYDETTMRLIAETAGVSLGNAYYYFRSKEHLIQAYYARSNEEHVAALETALGRERTLAGRLRVFIRTKIDTSEAYHRFAGQLFRTAADPESPLNPFSDASSAVREAAIGVLARVVDGSDAKVPADLRAELPRLLWMWEMGVILYWIHDRSEGRARTRKLADRTAELVAKLVAIASNPLMRPLRKMALELIEDVR